MLIFRKFPKSTVGCAKWPCGPHVAHIFETLALCTYALLFYCVYIFSKIQWVVKQANQKCKPCLLSCHYSFWHKEIWFCNSYNFVKLMQPMCGAVIINGRKA